MALPTGVDDYKVTPRSVLDCSNNSAAADEVRIMYPLVTIFISHLQGVPIVCRVCVALSPVDPWHCYSNRNRSCPYVDCNGKSRCETRDVNFLEIRRAVAAGSATHPPWVGKLAA